MNDRRWKGLLDILWRKTQANESVWKKEVTALNNKTIVRETQVKIVMDKECNESDRENHIT